MESPRSHATLGPADLGRFVRLLLDRVSEDALTEILDNKVHDAKADEAAAHNDHGWEDPEAEQASEELYDAAGEEAAAINNAGFEAQLAYLLEGMSEDGIQKELDAWIRERRED